MDVHRQTDNVAGLVTMPWWTCLMLLSSSLVLWLFGRRNSDDVIGLLEKILAIAAAMVVLVFDRNITLELLFLGLAFCLPDACPDKRSGGASSVGGSPRSPF
jgi:hypothetical protein